MRGRLVAALGERGFLGVYSLVAFATFIPLVGSYFSTSTRDRSCGIWARSRVVRGLMYLGMALVLSLVVAALLRPSPAAIAPGKAEVAGAYRITRHPLFMAVGLRLESCTCSSHA